MWNSYPAYVATSPDQTLAYPHYSDDRWRQAQLIYGKQGKTDESNYSDRLWQWDWTAGERASAVLKTAGINGNTARGVEAWLSAYHDRPVALRYILAQVNLSTGYPVYFYGYDYEVPA